MLQRPMRSPEVLFAALLVTAASCNLFETRTPEDPGQLSSNYVSPTVPDLVFQNMMNSFRDLNSVNYMFSFSDPQSSGRAFLFEPTSQGLSSYGSILLNWTSQSEEQYFRNIVSRIPQGTAPRLVFAFSPPALSSDSALYEAAYELTVPHTQTNIPQIARGRAQFYLIAKPSREWVIWRWVDLPNAQSDFTWSEMKGAFGQ